MCPPPRGRTELYERDKTYTQTGVPFVNVPGIDHTVSLVVKAKYCAYPSAGHAFVTNVHDNFAIQRASSLVWVI